MSGDQEALQKQLEEALEGKRSAEEKLEEQLKARENLEVELKRMREKKDSEIRLRSRGFLEEGNIKIEVEVDKVGKEFIFSPYTAIGGLPFRIGCKKEMRAGTMKVPPLLYCNENAARKWSALVAFSFKLHSSKTPHISSYNTLFGPPVMCREGISYNWDVLVKPSEEYIQNGRFTIDAQIKVVWYNKNAITDFSLHDSQLSDVTLLVGARNIHANRMYLAHYCKYFKVIFCSKFAEKDKNEIELKDIDPDEFEEMLGVIYPQRNKVTAATVTGLLRMADFFDVLFVSKKCTKFLKNSTDFSLAAKLQLSDEFRLRELQYHLLEELKTAGDIKAIINSADFGKLSLALKNSLLEKHFKLAG